jgi:serine/threonine protein kinase
VDTTNFNTKRLGAYDSPKEEIQENEKFEDIYILKEKLGEGAQAVVYRCESRLTGESFAVKITRTRSL